MDDVAHLWSFLPAGFATTIAIEAPILLLGLSAYHGWGRRLFAGVWLTACTYPIVVLVMPVLVGIDRGPAYYTTYLIIAETFAPVAECLLFWFAFHRTGPWSAVDRRGARLRDYAAIIVANLASFGLGWYLFD